jgi:SNF2 family DNA or RNA helicase
LLRRSRKDGVGRPDEPPVEVVVTTYTYFERESSSDDRKFLRAQKWSYLVLDEAHGVSQLNKKRVVYAIFTEEVEHSLEVEIKGKLG